jgi:hypothetical protein
MKVQESSDARRYQALGPLWHSDATPLGGCPSNTSTRQAWGQQARQVLFCLGWWDVAGRRTVGEIRLWDAQLPKSAYADGLLESTGVSDFAVETSSA